MLTFILLCLSTTIAAGEPALTQTPEQGKAEFVEVRGVAAGEFDAGWWKANTLNLVPDLRTPLLEPREGKFRNIYAPSAVKTENGWRVFYGAWDGVETGNDRIYCVDTPDFLSFGERKTVIEHGDFIHVCNVNAMQRDDGSWEMMCTVYPDDNGLNKPAYFTSPDGVTWNGSPMPYPARKSDIITIEGYEGYPEADINGMNVAFREDDGTLRLFFNNFKDFGTVYRATHVQDKLFRFDGPALECDFVVNDVKKFQDEGKPWYLMGLHMNREGLWYSLSEDGMKFSEPQQLLLHLGNEDLYIVAIGFVRDGNRLLGVLYGAGAVSALNENRIFARWLQKKAVFVADDGTRYEPERALGPDRQLLRIPAGTTVTGRFEVLKEDGVTPLLTTDAVSVQGGQVWEMRQD